MDGLGTKGQSGEWVDAPKDRPRAGLGASRVCLGRERLEPSGARTDSRAPLSPSVRDDRRQQELWLSRQRPLAGWWSRTSWLLSPGWRPYAPPKHGHPPSDSRYYVTGLLASSVNEPRSTVGRGMIRPGVSLLGSPPATEKHTLRVHGRANECGPDRRILRPVHRFVVAEAGFVVRFQPK
jgi:hypothetical protein